MPSHGDPVDHRTPKATPSIRRLRRGQPAVGCRLLRLLVRAVAAALVAGPALAAAAQTPIAGHYPPGQSGIRGAATPPVGWSYANFSRFFSNLEVTDSSGETVTEVDELRFANISMITWTTPWKLFGMTYGALAGIPFGTGNLTPSSGDVASSSFGLGDVLVTPLSLYAARPTYDFQLQLTVWTGSGRFEPGGSNNRGSGFWSLVYSIGGVYYPGGSRDDWSLSAVARFEQNFEQRHTGIEPGDDVVVDWGVGKVIPVGDRSVDLGVSGFGAWQLTRQSAASSDVAPSPYRYFGIGPEASVGVLDRLSLRLRLHWEFDARNAIRGNNVWLIANVRL